MQGLFNVLETELHSYIHFADRLDNLYVDFDVIERFHPRDLQSCGTQMIKAMAAMLVFLTKEVN